MAGMRNEQHADPSKGVTSGQDKYFCMLFEDMIVPEICHLRRQELNNQERFSCDGCSKDTLFRHTRAGRLNLCALAE